MKRRKYIVTLLILMISCSILGVSLTTKAEQNQTDEQTILSPEQLLDRQLETIELTEIKQFWEDIMTEYGGFLPENEQQRFDDFLKSTNKFSIKNWLSASLKFVTYEFVMNGKLVGTLILLTVFSMLLQTIQNSFEQSTVSKIAYAIVYIVLVIIALNSFHVAANYASEAIELMTSFILAIVPLLLAIIATSGGLISATFFHPIILFLMNVSGFFIKFIVLPLLFLSVLLNIVSTMSENYQVTKFAQLLRNWSVGLLTLFFTVFLGVISVQGASTAITDGVALRTAKFVTGNFVPVVGKMFTDATDTVINASVLLKNTIGISGLIILLLIIAFPALKILVIAFIYKASAALLQPLGGGNIIACMDIISKSVLYVFAALAIVSLMFFLSLTVIIAAGNITLMVR